MTGAALSAIKAWLSLSSNDANKHKGAITSYGGVVNHLLGRYPIEAVIAKDFEGVHNFRDCLFTPWDFRNSYGLNIELWQRL